MKFTMNDAELFIPDGTPEKKAVERTTHLAFGAHQDDIEIMASSAIVECYGRKDSWFTGVTLTDGRGSPRDGVYKDYTDDEMRAVRREEQRKAAVIGKYAAMVQLNFTSAAVKDPKNDGPVKDIMSILSAAKPDVVYTHNLADKHDTHVAVALQVVEAIRKLPPDARPTQLLGCEVWRSLDWLADREKVALDCSSREDLHAALVGVFDSQIAGGKRYDLATLGRRRANATYHDAYATDEVTAMTYAMDLMPLITDPACDIAGFIRERIAAFGADVAALIGKLL